MGNLALPDGALYVGSGLPAVGGGAVEPALVDPRQKVDSRLSDRAGVGLDYWPSYSTIPPASRTAYLGWLATGRSASNTPIGYVFLFFYGLERRVLVDARFLPYAAAEVTWIRAEVVRLLDLYGPGSNSFRSYATELLAAIDTLRPDLADESTRVPPSRPWELSLSLRARIGRIVAAEGPIPGDLALEWLRSAPEVLLRTPATRCSDEFGRLFLIRYGEATGEGMTIRAPRARLKAHYRPASASFGGPVALPVADLPDVAGLTQPVNKLRAIGDACTDELAAYSRWLGRNPAGQGSPAAAALLPAELIDGAQGELMASLRRWLSERLGDDDVAVVPAEDLLRHWPRASGWQPLKAECVSLAQLLGKLDIGLEPDVRFDGPALAPGGVAVLYRLGPGPTSGAATSDYAAAMLVARLGITIAAADGNISDAELSRLDEHLSTTMGLSPAERTRLRAHLAWLRHAAPPLSGLKKRVAELPLREREVLGDFIVAVAGSDGQVGPAEVATLGKLFKLLGLDPAGVFAKVHEFATTGSSPQRRAEQGGLGHAPDFILDMDRVQATLTNTATVSHLLGGVFIDDEPSRPSAAAGEPAIRGLDSAHSTLVRELRGRPTIGRSEFEILARGLGLLPDGALETINDISFDRMATPLTEGDDPIEIDAAALEEMLA